MQGSTVQFLAGVKGNTHLQNIQTGSAAHPTTYSMGTGGILPKHKVVGAMKLTTCLHLVPRLGINGVTHLLRHMSSLCVHGQHCLDRETYHKLPSSSFASIISHLVATHEIRSWCYFIHWPNSLSLSLSLSHTQNRIHAIHTNIHTHMHTFHGSMYHKDSRIWNKS